MTFEEILDQAIAMLQRRGRVTYQTLSHSRRRRMLLKINDLYHSAFVNIKPIESTTYAFTPLEMWPVLN